jgi:hypothetical protein
LDLLRAAYPEGVPDEDYLPLLVVLNPDLSARNLAAVIAELIDGEAVVVDNDAAAAAGSRRPPAKDVQRVRDHLMAFGYQPEQWR